MHRMLLSLALAAFLATPAMAEDEERGDPLFPSEEEMQELGRMAEGWMRLFADQMEPWMERFQELVDDLDAYEAPERLPNGDIIIRRKKDAPEITEDDGSIAL